jgi:hypothetical protein
MDAAGRDTPRSRLLTAMPPRFAQAGIGSIGVELPAFF